MNEIFAAVSGFFLPALLLLILLHGFVKKAPVYDLFVDGCREGIQSAVEITPYIIAVFVVIQIMTDSGALGLLEKLCAPLLTPLGIPKELISFMIMRPVSGSGTLAIVEKIAGVYGPDSFLCRCASVMMGSSETILYAVAVYFGATHVKKMRHTVASGVAGYAVGVWLAVLLCRIM